MGGYAWVTLATNNSYSLGALVLAHSLKKSNTAHKLVVLITSAVSESMRNQLSTVFDIVKLVDVLDSKDEAHLALMQRPELGITFTKIHCWRLIEFEKCVFLDADTLVVRNCDELFEREEFSAAPDASWPDCFNSGVFVFRPSIDTFNKILQFAVENKSFDGGDQGLLNQFFSNWATEDIKKHLPFVYNLTSIGPYAYIPAFKHYGSETRIVHFIGTGKPWLQQLDIATRTVTPSSGYEHLGPLLQQWWDLFCEKVHPNLDKNLESSNEEMSHSPVEACSNSLPIALTDEQQTLRLIPCTPHQETIAPHHNIPFEKNDSSGESSLPLKTKTLSGTTATPPVVVPEPKLETKRSEPDGREVDIRNIRSQEYTIRPNRVEEKNEEEKKEEPQEEPPPKDPFDYETFIPDENCIQSYLEQNVVTYQPFESQEEKVKTHKEPEPPLPRFLTIPEDDRRQSGNVVKPANDPQPQRQPTPEPIRETLTKSKSMPFLPVEVTPDPTPPPPPRSIWKSQPNVNVDPNKKYSMPKLKPLLPKQNFSKSVRTKSIPKVTHYTEFLMSSEYKDPVNLPKDRIGFVTTQLHKEHKRSKSNVRPKFGPLPFIPSPEVEIPVCKKIRLEHSEDDLYDLTQCKRQSGNKPKPKDVFKKHNGNNLEEILNRLREFSKDYQHYFGVVPTPRRRTVMCKNALVQASEEGECRTSEAFKTIRTAACSWSRGTQTFYKKDEFRSLRNYIKDQNETSQKGLLMISGKEITKEAPLQPNPIGVASTRDKYLNVAFNNPKLTEEEVGNTRSDEVIGRKNNSVKSGFSDRARNKGKRVENTKYFRSEGKFATYSKNQSQLAVEEKQKTGPSGDVTTTKLGEINKDGVSLDNVKEHFKTHSRLGVEENQRKSLLDGVTTAQNSDCFKSLEFSKDDGRVESSRVQSTHCGNENNLLHSKVEENQRNDDVTAAQKFDVSLNSQQFNRGGVGLRSSKVQIIHSENEKKPVANSKYPNDDVTTARRNCVSLHPKQSERGNGEEQVIPSGNESQLVEKEQFDGDIKMAQNNGLNPQKFTKDGPDGEFSKAQIKNFECQSHLSVNENKRKNPGDDVTVNSIKSSQALEFKRDVVGTESSTKKVQSKSPEGKEEPVENADNQFSLVVEKNHPKILDDVTLHQNVSLLLERSTSKDGVGVESPNQNSVESRVHTENQSIFNVENNQQKNTDDVSTLQNRNGVNVESDFKEETVLHSEDQSSVDVREKSDDDVTASQNGALFNLQQSDLSVKSQNMHSENKAKHSNSHSEQNQNDDVTNGFILKDKPETAKDTHPENQPQHSSFVVEQTSPTDDVIKPQNSGDVIEESPKSEVPTACSKTDNNDINHSSVPEQIPSDDCKNEHPKTTSSVKSSPVVSLKQNGHAPQQAENVEKPKRPEEILCVPDFDTPRSSRVTSKTNEPETTAEKPRKTRSSPKKTHALASKDSPDESVRFAPGIDEPERVEDMKSTSGIAGAIAQLSLQAGSEQTPESTAASAAHQEYLRRQNWETGNIDYMGRDSFDNIWSKICQTLETKEEQPTVTVEAKKPTEIPSETQQNVPEFIETLPGKPAPGPVEEDEIIFTKPDSRQSGLMNISEEGEEVGGKGVKLSDILKAESGGVKAKTENVGVSGVEMGAPDAKSQSVDAGIKPERVLTPAEVKEQVSAAPVEVKPQSEGAQVKTEFKAGPTEVIPQSVAGEVKPEPLSSPTEKKEQPSVAPVEVKPQSLPVEVKPEPVSASTEMKEQHSVSSIEAKPKTTEAKSELKAPPVETVSQTAAAEVKSEPLSSPTEKKEQPPVSPVQVKPQALPAEVKPEPVSTPTETQKQPLVAPVELQPQSLPAEVKPEPTSAPKELKDQQPTATPVDVKPQTDVSAATIKPGEEKTHPPASSPDEKQPLRDDIPTREQCKVVAIPSPPILPPETHSKGKKQQERPQVTSEPIPLPPPDSPTSEQPIKTSRSDSLKEKKGVFSKILEMVGVTPKEKNGSEGNKSVFYDVGGSEGETVPKEAVSEVKEPQKSIQVSDTKRKSPSPKLTIPQTPPETAVTTPTPPPNADVPPRKNSGLLKVEETILETPPVPETSNVQTEIEDIIGKAKSEVETLLQDAEKEAADAVNTMKLIMGEEQEGVEELRVTSEEERKRHKGEVVSSKLSDQILKAIPPPRRKAISDASASTSAIPKASPEQKSSATGEGKKPKPSSIPVPPPRNRGKPAPPPPSKGKGKK